MNDLKGKISEDLKQAMKSKDAGLTSVLRMLIAALRNKEISLRSPSADAGKAALVPSSVRPSSPEPGRGELTDEQVMEVTASEIKKRRDSVLAYAKGGRQELADKETAEIKILEQYLPEQLSEIELEKIIKEIIDAGATDLPAGQAGFGKVMGQAMARAKGLADGNRVGGLVKKLLGK